MCGRYSSSSKDLGPIAEDLGASFEQQLAEAYRPRYNVAPTQAAVIARVEGPGRDRWLRMGKWGLAGQINARAETVAEKPLFRRALERRRCVVPADGFFEWTGAKGARRPIWFHRPGGGLIWFAGLFDEDAHGVPSFTILTTTPSVEVAPVHDRMPVVFDAERARAWLDGPDQSLLEPTAPGVLIATPVSRRVSDVKHDDPECLAPWTPPQGSLFGDGS